MARYSNITTNFSGGLITDHLVGRTDVPRVENSARKYTNFFPTLQGPASYRHGTVHHSDPGAEYDTSVSVAITLATENVYRAVFIATSIKIYDADGTLKDTVASPYSEDDLADLRFSSETDVLYITHPNHRPRKLTADLVFVLNNLRDSGGNNLRDSASNQLRANVQVAGDDSWTLAEIDTYIEPFLERDSSTNKLRITKGEEIAKIVSTDAGLATITSAGTPTNFYVEYELEGIKLLGKVISSSSNYSEVVAPAVSNGVYTIYVDAVDFITKIEAPQAKLFLLDNAETTNGSVQETQLEQDGVPDGEVHLRSDTDIFNNGTVGTWIRVGSDRRSPKTVVQTSTQSLTRWVKVTEYVGVEDHPIEFVRYTTLNNNIDDQYTYGNVYKAYGDSAAEIRDDNNNKTAHIVVDANRTFTWAGGDINVSTAGTSTAVGDLTAAKAFEVVKCDPALTVTEYDASINTGGLLVSTTAANTTVTEIANDVTVNASEALFTSDTSADRFIKGNMTTGNVYMKILEYVSSKQVRARLRSAVPRDSSTGAFENNGVFESFNLGAWYFKNFPRAVAFYEQRRVYGGTPANPNMLYFSRVGDETNFAPTQDDKQVLDTDGLSYSLSNINASVRWLIAGKDLLIGTSKGVFKVIPNQFNVSISPKTLRIELSDEVGCKGAPILVGTSVFFPDESDTELMEYKYDSKVQRDGTNDISKLIYPTFTQDKIKKIEFQNNPQPRIYVLTVSGLLYVLTYHRDEDYYAWSKISSTALYKDITVLRNGFTSGLDKVWVTTVRANTSRFEYFYSEADTTTEPKYFLDGSTYNQSYDVASNLSSGSISLAVAGHADGTAVGVVIDDVYQGEYTVTSNAVSVPTSLTTGTVKYVVGLRYTGELQPMYPTWNGTNKPAYGSDEIRVISQKVFVINSHRFKQGVDGKFATVKLPGFNAPTSVSAYTGFDKERPVAGSQFGVDKIPEIQQDEPYELTIASLVTKTDLN